MKTTLMPRLHATPWRRVALLLATAAATWLSACGGGGPADPAAPTAVERVVHHWRIAEHRADRSTVDLVPLSTSVDEPVDASRDLGEFILRPNHEDPHAVPEAHATALGDVYWVAAQAPVGDLQTPSSAIGSTAYLDQVQTYRKTTDTGSLDLVISQATLEAIDSNPRFGNELECPEINAGRSFYTQAEWEAFWNDLNCEINAKLSYQVSAWKDVPITDASGKVTGYGMVELASGATVAHLFGMINYWHHAVGPSGDSNLHYKSGPDFVYDPNVDATPDQQHAILMLNQPAVVSIPLDAVAKDETFKVMVVVSVDVNNRRQLESWVGARFRDPQHLNGVSFNAQGVELIPIPPGSSTVPPPPAAQPAPACNGPVDPAAGTLQFESAKVYAPEGSGLGELLVWVTRSGGSAGEVSARFATQDGSAHAGVDYQAVSTLVRFNDGEQGKRVVAIPIVNNQVVDGVRTATLSLTDLRGCASLGAASQALLSIIDDDLPPPPSPTTFTLGGTVSGLAGSGLVLRDVLGGGTVAPVADGGFALPAPLPNGSAYELRVDAQPNNPTQNCVVANGSGIINGADVSNVSITCTAVSANGALDASFGAGSGKVSNAFPAAKAIALQADGKLLAVGGMTLSRYLADGSLDTAFGTGGKVSIVAQGGGVDAMQALVVQPDGRIVVGGYSSRPTPFNDDFAVLRFNADGSPDTSFGAGGLVALDFAGLTDRVHALLLQPDGKIVAAGFATLGTLVTADQDIALVRLTATGTLDPGFGTGGKLTVNVAGKADFGYAAALQADGKIVVAGRVGADGGADPDFGLLRVSANGNLDTGFGSNGVVRTDFGLGNWEEAAAVAVQADGRILVTGRVRVGSVFNLALARFNADGTPDAGFGAAGLATTAVSTQADVAKALAVQSDGKIVVVGQAASLSTNPDMVVARYLADGSMDAAFGAAGKLTVDFFGAIDGAEAVAVQPDGKIIAGGFARNAGTTGSALIRVVP
jgi:uncharacterized delta-60 repeat protein